MHDNRNNNMDSLYEDNAVQFSATPQRQQTKRPLTLDLNGALGRQQAKRKFNQSVTTPAGFSSPDLQKLNVATPDLEQFIINTPSLQTPSAGAGIVFPHKVTTEQEDYARGFEDALSLLQNGGTQQQPQQPQQVTKVTLNSDFTTAGTSLVANGSLTTASPPTTTSTILSTVGMSGGSVTYTNLDESYQQVTVKDEPQTVPNSPPMSPIDMESQERIKLERKRQRNRVAASKCRKRKLERISKLEDKVKQLKGENTELAGIIKALKEHVFQLKKQVIDHAQTGCNLPLYNTT